MSKNYLNIVKHYEECLEKFGDTHKGVDWPNEKDAFTRYEVMLGLMKASEKINLLDFGCGTAKLLDFIIKEKAPLNINYIGLDISKKYIEICKNKYPETLFHCFDVLEQGVKEIGDVDYAILNGVFTEKRELSFDEMWNYFKKLITIVFGIAKKGIAFNVMSKAVDWEREDLFHLSTDMLIDFMTKNLSRKFIIRNDYGLYEYTVYLYK